jgi:large subunit ribosomal protein L21
MFAVVRTGGKQYRVAAGDKIVVEKLAGEAGDTITLGDVLLAGEGAELRSTDGLTVSAEIIAQAKADKVIVFKKRRRHNYRRKKGHRQQHTILRIVGIGDQKAESKPKAAKKAAAPAETAAPAAEAPAAEAPAKKPRAKKADAKAQAPLKTEGAESPMTDTPVASKSDSE